MGEEGQKSLGASRETRRLDVSGIASGQTARVTLPAFRHDVHTFRRLGVEPTRVRTFWMLGFQRRLVRT